MRILLAFFILCAFATHALSTQTYALSIYGNPKYPKNFTHFDYVNPNAPKGGTLKGFALGTFDSLNPFVQKGNPAAELSTLVYNTLTIQSLDEPFSEYALVAESMTQGKDFIIFHLNKKARFSNGTPILAKDVVFSFENAFAKR